jgi:hypothetical protein
VDHTAIFEALRRRRFGQYKDGKSHKARFKLKKMEKILRKA